MAHDVRTLCNRDCPDACGIVATVEGGRITRLRGDPDHPVTQGFLCARTGRFLERQYAADRLTSPLWRPSLDQPFRAISWAEALDRAAEGLLRFRAESGPASIFHYRSGGSLGYLDALVSRFFDGFGPVTTKRGDICSGAADWAQEEDFGVAESNDLLLLRRARALVVWGKNVHTSTPHTVPLLKEAKARGVPMVAIDPVAHRTTAMADRHWAIRPGADEAFALAVGRLLFERGEVPAEVAPRTQGLEAFRALCFAESVEARCAAADLPVAAAEDVAALYATRPCATLVGWGMARRSNGAAIVRAVDALAAISGNLGLAGGGSSFYYRRRGAFVTPWEAVEPPRTICEPLFGAEVAAAADPPIRMVWVTAGNPVVMLPDSARVDAALRSRELVVVVDPFLTDTALAAHLVLPTTTLLEEDDMMGAYGHHWIGVSRPVVPPPPGVLSDLEIVQALAERVGLSALVAGDARSWKAKMLSPELVAAGVDLERLEAGVVRNPLAAEVVFPEGRVHTPDGRARLPTRPGPAPAADPIFPLQLMALSHDLWQSSQGAAPPQPTLPAGVTSGQGVAWTAADKGGGPEDLAEVRVHPEAAGDVADGAVARLRSVVGELLVRVRHDPRQRRDVVLMAKGGGWRRGWCANALVEARVTDAGEGGVLYEQGVRLEGV